MEKEAFFVKDVFFLKTLMRKRSLSQISVAIFVGVSDAELNRRINHAVRGFTKAQAIKISGLLQCPCHLLFFNKAINRAQVDA
ncbi:MAG: hypothetical protein HZB10_00375 [Candidatus Yonathbacteria bacterium]|nr:hypothetical protein [Candidatus Yonathbacteria bacterium]